MGQVWATLIMIMSCVYNTTFIGLATQTGNSIRLVNRAMIMMFEVLDRNSFLYRLLLGGI